MSASLSPPPLYTIPMVQRPAGHGRLFSKIVFPLIFNLGMLGINSAQFLFLILLLIPGDFGRRLYKRCVDWTKDGFGRLCKSLLPASTSSTLMVQ